MCVNPVKITNKRYLPTRKNNYNPSPIKDKRLYEIEVPCGRCVECRKRKARDWSIRLMEELKRDTLINNEKQTPLFITLTLSDDKAAELTEKYNLTDINEVAKKAVRLMLERYRKKNKTSFKHWLVTELGEKNGRLHLHGIIWLNISREKLEKLWSYGYIYIGEYVSPASINYITNYSLKINKEFAIYKPTVLCSKGIGENYITTEVKKMKQFNGKYTPDYYTLNDGRKVAMPKYYRNKLYTEQEREQLFIYKLEEEYTYVSGVKVLKTDTEKINKIRRREREQQEQWGISFDKSAKYEKINTNQVFEIDDSKRERQRKVKKEKKLREYVHGERIWNYNFNESNDYETDNFIFRKNGMFFRKYENNLYL